jgi:glyoxylate/hydroxypyruvate reductase A
MHIVVCLEEADASPWLERFRQALPDASFVLRPPRSPVDGSARQADYVIAGYRSETLFAEQRGPKAVFTLSAGVGHVTSLGNAPSHVPLVRVEDAGMAAQMARYVLAAVLRISQRFDVYAAQQRQCTWWQHPARDPADIAVGVLGLGVIGATIARAVAAHGFAVRGYARTDRGIEGIRCFAGRDAFGAFLDGLHVLVSVVPMTADTAGMLDHAALSRLADGAHVVNIGRGGVLVDEDLLAVLDSGKLSGATLDVFHKEPLPATHPFWHRPEITITPHVSGPTIIDLTVAQVAAKIRKLERGEAVTGVVDYQRGY